MSYNGNYDPVAVAIDLIRNARFLGIKVGRHGSDQEKKAAEVLLGQLAGIASEFGRQQRYDQVLLLLNESMRKDRSVSMMNYFYFEPLRGGVALGERYRLPYSRMLIGMNPDTIQGIQEAQKELIKRGIPVDRPLVAGRGGEKTPLLTDHPRFGS